MMSGRRILYIIDDASRMGGAHIATYALLRQFMRRGVVFDVLCKTLPEKGNYHGLDEVVSAESALPKFYSFGIRHHSFRWFIGGIFRRIFRCQVYPNWLLDPLGRIRRLMSAYDTVCVASEESQFRRLVACLPSSVRKVQMIHTNYAYWASRHKSLTFMDKELYSRYDVIACIGEISAEGFRQMYPELRDRVSVFYNVIEGKMGAVKPLRTSGPLRFITLARISDVASKDGPRMIRVAKRLHDAGCNFVWDVYGGGEEEIKPYREEVVQLGIVGKFVLHQFDSKARGRIAKADVMVLLSHYEGLPNVIYESLIAGTPVFSTSVGGIPEQITEGVNGWLVEDDEESIVQGLRKLCENGVGDKKPQFVYDNDKIVSDHKKLLFN